MRSPARLLLLLFSFCAVGEAQATLQGIIVNSVTSEPLARVQVHLTVRALDEGLPPAGYGAVTDDAGRFSISPIPPGTYMVHPERAGFYLALPQDKNATVPTLELKLGQQVRDYRLEMAPQAVISGRVLDEGGEPVVNADVFADGPGQDLLYFLGIWKSSTNDRGEYRMSLPAGQYRIRTEVPDYSGDEIRTDGTAPMTYPPTWHPNAIDVARAPMVDLRPGADIPGIDIQMRPLRLSIGGKVSGAPAGATATVSIQCLRRGGSTWTDITPEPDGSFSLGRLEPGACHLFAHASSGGRDMRSAVVELNLKDTPILELDLAIKPGTDISGALEMADKEEAANRAVRLEPLNKIMGRSYTGRTGQEGVFNIKGVAPGRYRPVVAPLPQGGYVKTVLLDGSTAALGVLDLRATAGIAQVKLATGKGAARLSGRVRDGSGLPVPLAMAYLVPEGDEKLELEQYAQAASDGAYSFADVAPGKYRLFARGATTSVSADEALAQAEAIEVKEGDRITKDSKLIAKGAGDGKK